MSKTIKVNSIMKTTDYSMFEFTVNRVVARHKLLKKSVASKGTLSSFPIVCRRGSNGKLIILDGQNRFTAAAELGEPIYFLETDEDFSIPEVNSSAEPWRYPDYALYYAQKGYQQYVELLEFCGKHGIKVSSAMTLLSGLSGRNSLANDFKAGVWEIRDRKLANSVAVLYSALVGANSSVASSRLTETLVGIVLSGGYSQKHWLERIKVNSKRVVKCETRDQYLAMLEDVYNFRLRGKPQRHVANDAKDAMRVRNPINAKSDK
jgi:hypothetical protein